MYYSFLKLNVILSLLIGMDMRLSWKGAYVDISELFMQMPEYIGREDYQRSIKRRDIQFLVPENRQWLCFEHFNNICMELKQKYSYKWI